MILNFAKGKAETSCKYLIMYNIDQNNKVNILSANPRKDSNENTVIAFVDFTKQYRPTKQEIEEALSNFLTLKK